jgi:RimJ/RimL family protein N-acetyltransferase
VFEHFKARKLAIRCDARNIPSRRVAESLGLTLDVRARNDSIGTDGSVRTTLFFSLLAGDAAALTASWPDEHVRLHFDPTDSLAAAPLPEDSDELDESPAFPRPVSIESDRLLLRPVAGRSNRLELQALDKMTGASVGGGTLYESAGDVPAIDIDWWLDRVDGDQLLEAELAGTLARFAFEAWRARRVGAWTPASNVAAGQTAEQLGFHFEGIMRHEYCLQLDAPPADWAVYSLVPDDLPVSLPEIAFTLG